MWDLTIFPILTALSKSTAARRPRNSGVQRQAANDRTIKTAFTEGGVSVKAVFSEFMIRTYWDPIYPG